MIPACGKTLAVSDDLTILRLKVEFAERLAEVNRQSQLAAVEVLGRFAHHQK